jgi:sugar lactone lactonase YvrE
MGMTATASLMFVNEGHAMKKLVLLAVVVVADILSQFTALAHPPAGIVVDQSGNVFAAGSLGPGPQFPGFVWKIDALGQATRFQKISAHWLALDAKGRFDRAKLEESFRERKTPWLSPVAMPDSRSSLLRADGCPILVHTDGNLYYGNLDLSRLTPEGNVTSLDTNLVATIKKLDGAKGLASGPDDALYISCPSAVVKVQQDGTVSTLVHPIVLKDCEKDPLDTMAEPGLRGLAVDSKGTVFAAAAGCRRVLKITPDGQVTIALKAEPPWSPTGVALHGDDIYVLEYAHANSDKHEDWQPRVRKLGRDGSIKTLATLSKEWN